MAQLARVHRLPPVTVELPQPAPHTAPGQPETLEDAWAVVLGASHQLAAQRWDISAAGHWLESARARRWPNLGLEGSYTVRSDEPAFRFRLPDMPLRSATFPYAQEENFAFRTAVEAPLYTSGQIKQAIAAAGARLSAAELELDQSVLEVKLQVAVEYVAVLRARRDLELARSTVASLEGHLRDVRLLHQCHQVPASDLLAAEVALADARQGAILAENQWDSSRAAYNRRLGRPLDAPVWIAEITWEPAAGDVAALTADALRNRPELARLRAEARALEHQSQSVVAQSRPQVALRAEYALEENRFRSPEGIAAAGVGVVWNVLDGGKTRHEAAALADQAESTRRLLAELESLVALEVRRAWLQVEETRRRTQATSAAIEQAEENLRVVRERYNCGMGTHTEVLDAEKLRTQAHRNHQNATCDAVLAVIRLRYATGEL